MRSPCLRTALLAALVFPTAIGARTTPLAAQTPRLEFEVASVKPSRSGPGPFRIGTQPGGRFVATNVTLRALIQYAYGMQPYQVLGGATWLSSDHFDIVAKAEAIDGDQKPASQTAAAMQFMVRALLADRFKLTCAGNARAADALILAHADGRLGSALHRAAVDCSAQTAAAAGSVDKAQAAGGAGGPCGIQMGLGSMVVGGATFPQVATALSGFLDRPVVDRTGLTGAFDATFRWTPDESTPGMAAKSKFVPTIDPNGASIFTAMQEQLGLKLEPARGQVEVLVIVSAQQPSPN